MSRGTYTNINEYIKEFPKEIQVKLFEIATVIKEVVPRETTTKISWDMPTFYLNGNLVHFAGHKNHIGFYPGESGIKNFTSKFKNLKHTKGGVQFKYEDPLPKELIQEIVRFRVEENLNK